MHAWSPTSAAPIAGGDLAWARLLLVEDDLGDQRLFTRQLRAAGLHPEVVTAGSIADALPLLRADSEVTLVLLDLGLPDCQGLDSLVQVAACPADVPVIVLTGQGDDEVAVTALRRGAHDYLVKGDTSPGELGRAVRYAIERHDLAGRAAAQLLHHAALHQLEVAGAAATDVQGFVQSAASAIQVGLDARRAAVRLVGDVLPSAAAVTAVDAAPRRGPAPAPVTEPDEPAVTEIALEGEGGHLGTLTVVSHTSRGLSPDQEQFLSSAAHAIVVRVERIAASAALSARTRQLDTVRRVAEHLQEQPGPGTALQTVADLLTAGIDGSGQLGVHVEVEGAVAVAGPVGADGGTPLTVPVTVRGEDVGTVELVHPEREAWGPDELTLLSSVGALLGTWWSLARADAEHQRDVDRITQLMQTAPVGLALVTPTGSVSFANSTALQLLGVEHMAAFPWRFDDPAGLDPALAAVDAVRRTGRPVRDVRVAVPTADGAERALAVNASALAPTPRGRGMAVSITDVTAERRRAVLLEAALDREQEAAEELRRVGALKDGFLRAVSHELRTPLASIFGFTETLRDHVEHLERAQIRHMLERLHTNAHRLALLLEDLLDVGRITAGVSSSPDRSTHDLADIVRDIAELLPMDGRRLDLQLESVVTEVERPKVERVVHNLLGNTVRHTPSGTTVRVLTRREGSAAVLVVEDDGPGIPHDDRGRMFEPFVQGDAASTAASPGTGVGLSLVRQFVDLHDGEVVLDESPQGGARFTVTFPDP